MRNLSKPTTATLVGVLLLALAGGVDAANKKAKPGPPPKPIPTDKELGFFGNTRDEMRANIKRVGLMPVRMPSLLDDREDAEKLVQETVIRQLTAAGFEVVGPASYQEQYDRFNKQLGGMYDPQTGIMKRDVAGAVYSNAQREFIGKNRLDGYVLATVVTAKANYFGKYARWDGVHDRCDGEIPDAVVRFMQFGDSSEGSVPALSLRIQIVNAQGRVTYGADGGIELLSYFKDLTFKRVPYESLLKDTPRVERAVRVATVGLAHTPVQIRDGEDDPLINAEKISLKDLPPQPAAAEETRKSPLLVPRDQILSSVKRVALSPVSAFEFKDIPDDVLRRLGEKVRTELEPLGWEIVDSPRAREALISKMLQSQVFDPFTGKRDEARITEIRKSVFKDLGTDTPPDAIVWLSVVKTTALQRGGDVIWDGVNQNSFSRGPVIIKMFGGSAVYGAGSGGIQTSSLLVSITDSNDTALYRSQGGIEIIQSIKVTPRYIYNGTAYDAEVVDMAPNELFRDVLREKPAVHAALRDLVMTPDALYAELNPNPKKTKSKKEKKKT